MSKFIFLQYVDEASAPAPGTPQMQAVIDAYARYLEEVQKAGVFLHGDGFQPSAATFSVEAHNGSSKTTDGPMYDKSPWLNGYFLLDCKDRGEAEAWAAKNPAAAIGTVEVHPILQF